MSNLIVNAITRPRRRKQVGSKGKYSRPAAAQRPTADIPNANAATARKRNNFIHEHLRSLFYLVF
jgi:hypothetical protein